VQANSIFVTFETIACTLQSYRVNFLSLTISIVDDKILARNGRQTLLAPVCGC